MGLSKRFDALERPQAGSSTMRGGGHTRIKRRSARSNPLPPSPGDETIPDRLRSFKSSCVPQDIMNAVGREVAAFKATNVSEVAIDSILSGLPKDVTCAIIDPFNEACDVTGTDASVESLLSRLTFIHLPTYKVNLLNCKNMTSLKRVVMLLLSVLRASQHRFASFYQGHWFERDVILRVENVAVEPAVLAVKAYHQTFLDLSLIHI